MTDRSTLRLAAVDIGAESGRVLVCTFDGGRLAIEDVHRFPNVPVTVAGTMHWDALRLFGDITAGLRKAGAAGEHRSTDEFMELMGTVPNFHWQALLRDNRPNKPLILAVEGYALAGGTEILAGTDIRGAEEAATSGVTVVSGGR